MSLFARRQRSHLKVEDLLPAPDNDFELVAKPLTLDELHMAMLQARSRVVHCQGELARAEEAADEAELAMIRKVNDIGFNPKLVEKARRKGNEAAFSSVMKNMKDQS